MARHCHFRLPTLVLVQMLETHEKLFWHTKPQDPAWNMTGWAVLAGSTCIAATTKDQTCSQIRQP